VKRATISRDPPDDGIVIWTWAPGKAVKFVLIVLLRAGLLRVSMRSEAPPLEMIT
jgi:hypothetical protein